MRRRRYLLRNVPLVVIVTGAILLYASIRTPRLRTGRTNVLLVMIDTLRADHLGCYGYEKPTSATIDALAAEGVLFEQAVANCSWTRPSIASLLTGVYPRTTGVYKEKFDALSPEVDTLAEMFHDRGYATLGVTANPSINSDFGFDRGFDHYGDCGSVWAWMKLKKNNVEDKRRDPNLEEADSVTDRALALLEQHEQGPFYLQVLYIDPHTPYRPPEAFNHPLNTNPKGPIDLYDAEIAFADGQIGRLLSFVREHHPDTLIVVLSDHGEGLDGHSGLVASSTHGYHLYDSVLKVPLIFHHPQLAAGARFPDQVQLLDLVPTLAELFELNLDDQAVGTSLVSILRGEEPPPLPGQVFSDTFFKGVDKVSVREPGYKLVINRNHLDHLNGLQPEPASKQSRRSRKVIEACGPTELYVLPGGENPTVEGLNRVGEEPETARRLRQAILDWEARTPARAPINRDSDREVDSTVIRQLKALGYLGGEMDETQELPQLPR